MKKILMLPDANQYNHKHQKIVVRQGGGQWKKLEWKSGLENAVVALYHQ